MAEHDSEREPEEKEAPLGGNRGDSDSSSPGDSPGTPPAGAPPGAPSGASPPGDGQDVPFDEDAAWRAIVAGYGEEPADPPGAKPFKSVEDLALLEADPNDSGTGSGTGSGIDLDDRPSGRSAEKSPDEPSGPSESSGDQGGPSGTQPLGSSVAFAPGVGGPRDYRLAEPDEDGSSKDGKGGKGGGDAEDDEGHFVPPEPPPLPAADATAKFAWLGVLGGPLLLLLAVLLGWHMTWWLATLGIGGFLGGFATLVLRMNDDDEEDDDPGRGAVV